MKQDMFVNLSAEMRQDIIQAIRTATAGHRIVQISQLAEEVRRRHLAENIALEDIEEMLVGYAQVFSVMMEFDSAAVTTAPLPETRVS
jgi:hypothetical protein